jgi:hypothetical protein
MGGSFWILLVLFRVKYSISDTYELCLPKNDDAVCCRIFVGDVVTASPSKLGYYFTQKGHV